MKRKIVVVLFIIIIGFVSFYIYFNKNRTLTTKKINYNGNDLMINIDGNSSSTLPTSGTYYLSSYKCNSNHTKVIWNKDSYTLSITNGTKKARVACDLEFSSKLLLSQVEFGSYVAYTGNNGCTGSACKGNNANYVSDSDMGYCGNSNYKFTVNGFRVGYIENNTAYLISAGATDCLCTSSDGKVGTNCSSYDTTDGSLLHLNNLDEVALKYCNSDYAYGGVCDSNSSWAMNGLDFQKITGNSLSSNSCYLKYGNMSCGYSNDLIDNGGYYWYATSDSSLNSYVFGWYPGERVVNKNYSNVEEGIRSVLRLASSVYVTGGSGTYEDPYTIANN